MKLIFTTSLLFFLTCTSMVHNNSKETSNSVNRSKKSKYISRYYVLKDDSSKTISGVAFGEPPLGIKTFSWDSLQIFLRDSCKNYKMKKVGGKIKGKRTKEEIRDAVGKNIPSVRYTYNRFLRINPNAKGKAIYMISVNEDGKVIGVCVCESSLNDMDFNNSLIANIERWKFKRLKIKSDTTVFTCPFVFEYPNKNNSAQ